MNMGTINFGKDVIRIISQNEPNSLHVSPNSLDIFPRSTAVMNFIYNKRIDLKAQVVGSIPTQGN